MSKAENPFRYFHSSPEIIRMVVMLYVRYPLSLRNVEDLLFERGYDFCHETVRLWWNRFGPKFAAETRGDCLFCFGIDLAKPETGFELARRRGKCGCHLAAGAAPGSPEVNEKGNVAPCSVGIEIGSGQLNGLADKEGSAASPAFSACSELFHRNPVGCRAGRTHDDPSVVNRHRFYSWTSDGGFLAGSAGRQRQARRSTG